MTHATPVVKLPRIPAQHDRTTQVIEAAKTHPGPVAPRFSDVERHPSETWAQPVASNLQLWGGQRLREEYKGGRTAEVATDIVRHLRDIRRTYLRQEICNEPSAADAVGQEAAQRAAAQPGTPEPMRPACLYLAGQTGARLRNRRGANTRSWPESCALMVDGLVENVDLVGVGLHNELAAMHTIKLKPHH